ncbi:hypothetical protein [Pseudonocardia sp. ICBG1293]|uniref:hypothetical protein n=1 Tax=Pseudonocardia sp. ICBG1293 TaxID=2844382 RepID=UPI001CCA9352|nr:hypothetical protein [Pseudonocardia sp. ICBG1293]
MGRGPRRRGGLAGGARARTECGADRQEDADDGRRQAGVCAGRRRSHHDVLGSKRSFQNEVDVSVVDDKRLSDLPFDLSSRGQWKLDKSF